MNIADKMERESRLMTNLADWMQTHGDRVLYELSRIRYNYQLGLFEITYLANDII